VQRAAIIEARCAAMFLWAMNQRPATRRMAEAPLREALMAGNIAYCAGTGME